MGWSRQRRRVWLRGLGVPKVQAEVEAAGQTGARCSTRLTWQSLCMRLHGRLRAWEVHAVLGWALWGPDQGRGSIGAPAWDRRPGLLAARAQGCGTDHPADGLHSILDLWGPGGLRVWLGLRCSSVLCSSSLTGLCRRRLRPCCRTNSVGRVRKAAHFACRCVSRAAMLAHGWAVRQCAGLALWACQLLLAM